MEASDTIVDKLARPVRRKNPPWGFYIFLVLQYHVTIIVREANIESS